MQPNPPLAWPDPEAVQLGGVVLLGLKPHGVAPVVSFAGGAVPVTVTDQLTESPPP
jgi:hypothetical protein